MARATLMDAFNAAAGFGNQALGIAGQLQKDAADAEQERIFYDFSLKANQLMDQLRRSPSASYATIPEQYKKFQDTFFNDAKKQVKNAYSIQALDRMYRNSDMQMQPQIQDLMFRKEVDYSVSEKMKSIQNVNENPGLSAQQKISDISNILIDGHNRGYYSYEYMNTAISKYTAEAVFNHGISTVDRKYEEAMTYFSDPLRDQSKDSEYLQNLSNQLTEELHALSMNDPLNPDSLMISVPGMNGGSLPLNMDMTEIKKNLVEYNQARNTAIKEGWQRANGEIASDIWNKMNGLDPNDPGYIRQYNAYAREGNLLLERWDSDHFTEDQQNAYTTRFRLKEDSSSSSRSGGSNGSIKGIFDSLVRRRSTTFADYHAGVADANVLKARFISDIQIITDKLVDGGYEAFMAEYGAEMGLDTFIPDAVNAFFEQNKDLPSDILTPLQTHFKYLIAQAKDDPEMVAELNRELNHLIGYMIDALGDRGVKSVESVRKEVNDLAVKLVSDSISYAKYTQDGVSLFQNNDKGKADYLRAMAENPGMVYQDHLGNIIYAGNDATHTEAQKALRDDLATILGIEDKSIITPFLESEGAGDVSGSLKFKITEGKGLQNGTYRFVPNGNSISLEYLSVTGEWLPQINTEGVARRNSFGEMVQPNSTTANEVIRERERLEQKQTHDEETAYYNSRSENLVEEQQSVQQIIGLSYNNPPPLGYSRNDWISLDPAIKESIINNFKKNSPEVYQRWIDSLR